MICGNDAAIPSSAIPGVPPGVGNASACQGNGPISPAIGEVSQAGARALRGGLVPYEHPALMTNACPPVMRLGNSYRSENPLLKRCVKIPVAATSTTLSSPGQSR